MVWRATHHSVATHHSFNASFSTLLFPSTGDDKLGPRSAGRTASSTAIQASSQYSAQPYSGGFQELVVAYAKYPLAWFVSLSMYQRPARESTRGPAAKRRRESAEQKRRSRKREEEQQQEGRLTNALGVPVPQDSSRRDREVRRAVVALGLKRVHLVDLVAAAWEAGDRDGRGGDGLDPMVRSLRAGGVGPKQHTCQQGAAHCSRPAAPKLCPRGGASRPRLWAKALGRRGRRKPACGPTLACGLPPLR